MTDDSICAMSRTKRSKLRIAGNNPHYVLVTSIKHKLELKAWTLLGGILATLIMFHQLSVNTAYYQRAEESGHDINAINTTTLSYFEDFYARSGPPYHSSYEFWWLVMWSAVGVSWSSLVVTILPLWVLGGNTFVRWRTCVALVGLVFVMNTGVQILLPAVQYSGVRLPEIAVTTLSFLTQIVPMVVGPWVMRGQLRSSMRDACRMQSVIVLVELLVAVVIAGVVAPAFSRASPSIQVGIRLVIFPIFVEILVMVSRCSGIRYLKPHVPQDVMLGYISQAVMLTAIVGRFLTTNMNTTTQTVLVSVATATIEIVMRLTMVHRDGFYQSVCSSRAARGCRRCGQRLLCQPKAQEPGQESDSSRNNYSSDEDGTTVAPLRAPTPPPASDSRAGLYEGAAGPVRIGQRATAVAPAVKKQAFGVGIDSIDDSVMDADPSFAPELQSGHAHSGTGSSNMSAHDLSGSRPNDDVALSVAADRPRNFSSGSAADPHNKAGLSASTSASPVHRMLFPVNVDSKDVGGGSSSPVGRRLLDAPEPAQSLLPVAAMSIHVPHSEASSGSEFASQAGHRVQHLQSAAERARLRRVGNNAVNTQSYYAFLIADTMGEDIGIFASLSLSLLFRVPARRGELPISAEQVVIRVLIQYLLEALTDIGPALTYYISNILCGVRLTPVTSRMVAASVGLPPRDMKRAGALKRPPAKHVNAKEPADAHHALPTQPGVQYAAPSRGVSSTPLGLATPGGNDLGAIAELSELDSESDDSFIGSVRSMQSVETAQYSRSGSLPAEAPLEPGQGGSSRESSCPEALKVAAQAQDMDRAVDFSNNSALQVSDDGACAVAPSASDQRHKHNPPSPPEAESGKRGEITLSPATVAAGDSRVLMAGSDPAALGMAPAPPRPARRSLCCCPSLLLREEDADVQAASAVAHDAFALRRRGIASDPIWQPVNMRQLLHMAVFGRAEPAAGAHAADDTQSRDEGGAPHSVSQAIVTVGVPASGVPAQARELSQMSDVSERELAAAKPRRVLFRQVQAGALDQLSSLQYAAVWLSLRTELLAVRLSRAWETRVPGWTVLYVFSTLHALNLTTRILTGVGLRCPYVDPAGDWYWNFCTPAE